MEADTNHTCDLCNRKIKDDKYKSFDLGDDLCYYFICDKCLDIISSTMQTKEYYTRLEELHNLENLI